MIKVALKYFSPNSDLSIHGLLYKSIFNYILLINLGRADPGKRRRMIKLPVKVKVI